MTDPFKSIKFSADGIRGLYGEWPLIGSGTRRLGAALAKFANTLPGDDLIIVGRDTRSSGAKLSCWLNAGLSHSKLQIIDVGILSTPALSYITRKMKAKLGIMISASHSNSIYNGIKWVNYLGFRLQSSDEEKISILFEDTQDDYVDSDCNQEQEDSKYIDRELLKKQYASDQLTLSEIGISHLPRILIDCANGGLSSIAQYVFESFTNTVIINTQYGYSDIINDKCGSEYVRQYPEHFISKVRKNFAQYGFAFDGDGDRLVAVDSSGRFYNGDDFLFGLSRIFQHKVLESKNTIVTTKMANTGLLAALDKYKVNISIVKNGDKFLERELQEHGYFLGSEQVGNLLINDGNHAAADPLYALLIILKYLAENKTSLEELTDDLEKYPQILVSIKFPNTWSDFEINGLVDEVMNQEETMRNLPKEGRVIRWCSTTEPGYFHLMLEGKKHEPLNELLDSGKLICTSVQNRVKRSIKEIHIQVLSGK